MTRYFLATIADELDRQFDADFDFATVDDGRIIVNGPDDSEWHIYYTLSGLDYDRYTDDRALRLASGSFGINDAMSASDVAARILSTIACSEAR
jgi:hypothetical protein